MVDSITIAYKKQEALLKSIEELEWLCVGGEELNDDKHFYHEAKQQYNNLIQQEGGLRL